MADEPTLRASGLFSSKEQGDGTDGRIYDRFRKRVTFPICNESGRVIAFTARTLETGEKAGAKYINSPETPLYVKGQVLFNLDKAKSAIRQAEFALLVEGQMDCISVYLRGIHNVIATSGTAFTEQQVRLLKRHVAFPGRKPQLVANFDPDVAGENAAAKTIDLLVEEGFNIKIVVLDGGLDPDRYIRERGVDAYVAALRGARSRSDFLIERARQLFPGSGPGQKVNQLNYLLPQIRRSPEMIEREQFASNAAQKLGIDSAVLRDELRRAALKRRDHIEVRSSGPTYVEKVLIRALVSMDLSNQEIRLFVVTSLEGHPEWFEHLASYQALCAMAHSQDPLTAVTDLSEREMIAAALIEEGQIPNSTTDKSQAGFVQARALTEERVVKEVEGLRLAWLEKQKRDLEIEIANAERKGDQEGAIALAQRRLDVEREVRNILNRGTR